MSDLRTGLPWQMVEIHEPVRLLFVIEATPAALLRIMEKNPVIQIMVGNRWVQLASLHPETGALSMYHDGVFEPHISTAGPLPVAASSKEWYTGWRDHLEFAEIASAAASLLIVAAPVTLLAIFFAAFLFNKQMTEATIGRSVQGAIGTSLIAALSSAVIMLGSGLAQYSI
eukprot:gene9784-12005_t